MNRKELSKYAAVAYVRMLLWLGFCTLAGMGLIWLAYQAWLLVAAPASAIHKPLSGWLYWMTFACSGLLLVVLLRFVRIHLMVRRNVWRMRRKLDAAISPEEKRRFEELNTLHSSKDSAQRERYLKLLHEYQEKVREAVKK